MNHDYPTEMNELLQQYMDGQLDASGISRVETLLGEDDTLQQQLANLQHARDAVRLYGLKEQVAGIHMQMMQEMGNTAKVVSLPAKDKPRTIRNILRIAATVVVFLAGLLIYRNATPDASRLFADNYTIYKLDVARNAGGTRPSEIEEAYRQGKMDKVLLITQDKVAPTAKELFLAGNAALEKGETAKAITFFTTVGQMNQSNPDAGFKEDAEYYLGLSYLKQKQPTEAFRIFQTIHDRPAHLYHEKATNALLQKIKKLID
jgi:tetratricopeptide (TPR) repeat protein